MTWLLGIVLPGVMYYMKRTNKISQMNYKKKLKSLLAGSKIDSQQEF